MKTRNILLLAVIMSLFSCKPSIEEFSPAKGKADFSNYVAVGDGWTAGFADGALYLSGQDNSIPIILEMQFKKAGGGDFKQPLMLDDYGVGFTPTLIPVPKLVLGYKQDCLGVTGLSPVYPNVVPDPENFLPIGNQGPFNNLGVPGWKAVYMSVPGLATLNPYYGRFAYAPDATMLGEIPRVDATFFTLWLGGYDILDYARNGGTVPISDETAFSASLGATLQTLMANGAMGAMANIPYVLDAPFFTTVPYNALALTDQSQADMLNAGYAMLNNIIKLNGSDDTIHFEVGPNPLVIVDAILPWGLRQIRSDELVLLTVPQDSIKCAGWGSQKPIPGEYTLTATEISNVRTATLEFNMVIENLAQNEEVALVDMYSFMEQVNSGVKYDGVGFSQDFITGNFYSLDGLNFTPAGNAVVANQFIAAINGKFDANIPEAIVSDYPAVTLP